MMDEADTHRIGFRIRAQIGRLLAPCIDAWDHVRPPKDEVDAWFRGVRASSSPPPESSPHSSGERVRTGPRA